MLKIWSTAVTHTAATQVLLTDLGVCASCWGSRRLYQDLWHWHCCPFWLVGLKWHLFLLPDEFPTNSPQHTLSAFFISSSSSTRRRWKLSCPVHPLSQCKNTICNRPIASSPPFALRLYATLSELSLSPIWSAAASACFTFTLHASHAQLSTHF